MNVKFRPQACHSLVLQAPYRLAWVAEELPPLGRHDILVRTLAGAISIGTEVPQYCGTSRQSRPLRYPLMTGYESLGEVVACGPAVEQLSVGDRVIAFYGHRTAAVLPETRAIPVPSDITASIALLVILACDSSKGIAKLAPRPEEAALITGAGTIGLLTLFNLRASGIQQVDVSELLADRQALAEHLGARAVLDPGKGSDTQASYQLGVECSSSNAAFDLLQERMQPGGRICIVADGNREPLVLSPAFHEKELLVVGSSDGVDYQQYALWFWEHSRGYAAQLEALFQLRITADELAESFAELAAGAVRPVKVLVDYTL